MAERYVYWDVGCFLRLVNRDPDSFPVLSAIMEQSASRDSDLKIITSVLTVTQVAYADSEKDGDVDGATLEQIERIWEDRSAFRFAEFHEFTAKDARGLVRVALQRGWNRKPEDMIHLATAKQEEASEFHTFDGGLAKWSELIGMPISKPSTPQPRLFED